MLKPSRTNQELLDENAALKQRVDELQHLELTMNYADDALGESERRLKKIIDMNPLSMAIVSMDGTIEYLNRRTVETFGYQLTDIPDMEHWWKLAYPDEAYRAEVVAQWMGLVEKAMVQSSEIEAREYRITCKNGTVKTVDVYGMLTGDKLFVMFADITERKLTEQTLRESEEKYRLLAATPDALAVLDQDCRYIYVNDHYVGLFDKDMVFVGRDYADCHNEEAAYLTRHAVGRSLDLGTPYEDERWGGRTGRCWHRTFNPSQDRKTVTIVFRDITEHKRAEEALRKSEEKYRSLASVADRVFVLDRDCRFLFANKNYLDLFGPQGDKIIGKKYGEFHSVERARVVADAVQYVLKTGTVFQREHFGVRNSLSFLQKFSPVSNSEGSIYAVTVISIDITSLKLAEKELRESEEKYRSLACTVDGLFLVDRDCRYLSANQAYLDIFGTLKDAVIGKKHSELHDEEADKIFTEAVKYVVETGNPYQDEWFGKKRNQYLIRTFSPVRQNDGSIGAVTVVAKDITERKRAEAKVRDSLKEKELLLKEIHHRVKNNMQVISSILKLQGSASGHLEIFENCQQRIRSMALIHEITYKSGKLTRIDLADYTRELAEGLIHAYSLNPAKIDLIIEARGVTTDMNKAIPCGLVLNELITNALKHAFPNGSAGELRIAIRETENRETQIVIQDNGPGMPEDVDPHQPEGVGLYLVNGLVKNQLGGQWEVARNHGTEVRITFPS